MFRSGFDTPRYGSVAPMGVVTGRLYASETPHSILPRYLNRSGRNPNPFCSKVFIWYSSAMMTRYFLLLVIVVLGAGWASSSIPAYAQAPHSASTDKPAKPGGYVLERDKDVARNEPGTHNGGGETIGYSFFSKTPNLRLVFRKRAFKPGSAIGYHVQREDEIYYILSGRGLMTIDGKEFEVGPGDAILTRPGSSHGLKQIGKEDLVILINYEQAPKP